MEKPEYFNFVGMCPMFECMRSTILLFGDDEWNKFTFRQKTIVGHKQTQTIPLMFDYKKKNGEVLHDNYFSFVDNLNAISNFLHDLNFPYHIKRSNIVKLFANSDISPHIDKGEFLSNTKRLHIPIVTNEKCTFIVDGIRQHMAEGEVWEINNTDKIHSVHNEGKTDRIHLIIDVG